MKSKGFTEIVTIMIHNCELQKDSKDTFSYKRNKFYKEGNDVLSLSSIESLDRKTKVSFLYFVSLGIQMFKNDHVGNHSSSNNELTA